MGTNANGTIMFYKGTNNICALGTNDGDLILKPPSNTSFNLIITPPTGTSPAIIQTIQQGVTFNQNIVFQNSGGNVGIGTLTNITEKYLFNGNIKAYINFANDANDYTYIGTADVENTTTNTSIILQGKTGTYTGSQQEQHLIYVDMRIVELIQEQD
jgi:hypothetical protein